MEATDVISPIGALERIEAFNRELWEMVDSDQCPFTAPAKQGVRERLAKAFKGNQELNAMILRRFFDA